jgi:hypothetical protein
MASLFLPMEQYRHIPVERTDWELPRRKRGVPIQVPSRDPQPHGESLQESIESVRREFKGASETRPPEFDPALIFKIRMTQPVDEVEWQRSRLTLLSTEPEQATVVFADDVELTDFRYRLNEYSKGIPEDQQGPSYSFFSSIEEFERWGAEDRKGQLLAAETIQANESYLLDVEVWHANRETARKYLEQVKDFVTARGGEYLDDFIGASLAMARLRVTGKLLQDLLEVEVIYRIDFPPQPTLRYLEVFEKSVEDFPPTPIPPPDSPSICVIDSGIFRGHPMLGPAIGETIPVPVSLETGLDDHGHGTFVAGIALYGSVEESVQQKRFAPKLFLHGARVTNAENRFDDETLIVKQMDRAIRYFHDNYACRVFNVSLGDERLVYGGGKPSTWAAILDEVARELDIIIVISAGNYDCAFLKGNALTNYPEYLFSEDARIIAPATASIALTVGAIAPPGSPFVAQRYPNDPAYRPIAEANQPSPFTRRGPGVLDAIKPELCEYGGNSVYDGRADRVLPSHQGIPILSTYHKPIRLFTIDSGTSCAAPKVAHIAARVLEFYPDASANLVRALIANSARVPQATSDWLNTGNHDPSLWGYDNDDVLKLCGYGRPNFERAVYSTDNRVTLHSEDELPLGKFHIYEVPIPEVFRRTTGERHVSVALAFDPPTRSTRIDYLGVKMRFDLIRGKTIEEVVQIYQPFENKEEEVKLDPPSARCEMHPLITRRQNSTLQRALHVIKRRPRSDWGDTYWLVVQCMSTKWTDPDTTPPQRYAIVVTLEHREKLINLYQTVQQRVREAARARVRV